MRILIAEDDEALARFVRQGLEGEHYTVDAFKDGEQSLSAALACDYEAVILDLNLPKLDGVAVLRQLRMKKPSLPILILTQRTRDLPQMSLNLDDSPRIRVLVVDDSAFMRTALARMVSCEPDMEVVATASCASVAFEKIASLDPDVVTLDVNMPGLDGLGTLRCIIRPRCNHDWNGLEWSGRHDRHFP
jgi:DNA-binding response OmpR family regulator